MVRNSAAVVFGVHRLIFMKPASGNVVHSLNTLTMREEEKGKPVPCSPGSHTQVASTRAAGTWRQAFPWLAALPQHAVKFLLPFYVFDIEAEDLA